jgi:hypothetical protein
MATSDGRLKTTEVKRKNTISRKSKASNKKTTSIRNEAKQQQQKKTLPDKSPSIHTTRLQSIPAASSYS